MDKRVFSILEYDKIKERLAGYAASQMGKDAVRALEPSGNGAQVQTFLAQTAEAETVFIHGGQSPIEGFDDIRPLLMRIHASYSLSMGELLQAARCLRVSRTARERLAQGEAEGHLAHMASQLVSHRSIEEEIGRCILSDDEMSDAASPELASIRRQMRINNERAREKLNGMIKSTSFQKYLQEPIVTIRNGRFVLPVRQEFRQNVPGLVHDQSGSGATLFVEPMAVVELGNEYKRLTGLEQEEIGRILASLTAMLEPCADGLAASLEVLAVLDMIFAKAAMARDMRAVCPEINTQGHIKIVKGRHPLISQEQVVPIDVWLGEDFSTLIITGPNTGGKTVTLKTIGLFTLMAQSGMYIPALGGTKIAVFEAVFADIGDEQSIEQSLSTFSSHMKNLVHILKQADKRSLVLLDELGAGTDPVEGAALAMSILETLHERRCVTAATTHYSEIKAFAMTTDGMENASMEFDVDRLAPTYRLFIGIPGKSNAFEISKRLGLSDAVIDRARGFLKQEDVQFEDVIQSAEAERQRVEAEHRLAQEARQELERLQGEIEKEKKHLQEEKAAMRAKAREEARQVVRDTRAEMDKLVEGLRNVKGIDMRQVDRAIQQARDGVRKREGELAEPILREELTGDAPKVLRPGDRVRLLNLGQNATVLKVTEGKSEIQVQAGVIKMMVERADVRLIDEIIKPAATSARMQLSPEREAGLELDIRGKNVDEAIVDVDRYIDDAVINGRTELHVIHGKGTGALRTGIQTYLRKHPKVKTIRLGTYGEGDAGVTVVTLKA